MPVTTYDNGVGILPGKRISFIDHLLPLCQKFDLPLLVTDPWIKQLCEIYYPPMQIILAQPEDYCLDEALEPFDAFFYVNMYRLATGGFQLAEYTCSKRATSYYCMHGNSDKFRHNFWIERLVDEHNFFYYGTQTLEYIAEKGLSERLGNLEHIGNYRLDYWKKHRAFLDRHVAFLEGEKTKVLYAPTWMSENKKSELRFDHTNFFEVYEKIFQSVPDEVELIVKFHPHLDYLHPELVEQVKQAYPHIHYLNDFPLIYPLLNKIDIYVGDYSSIGYDFLYFDRPLFFVGEKQGRELEACGEVITTDNFYEKILQPQEGYSDVRRKAYERAFAC